VKDPSCAAPTLSADREVPSLILMRTNMISMLLGLPLSAYYYHRVAQRYIAISVEVLLNLCSCLPSIGGGLFTSFLFILL
jgi:hypothetical protein